MKLRPPRVVIIGILGAAVETCAAQSMAPILTRAYDNARTGWNQKETVLTQANVSARGIVRATIIPVLGDARGLEAQPLVLPRVRMADGTTHDVMMLPSMANFVRAVDASSSEGLWSVTLGKPVQGSTAIDFHLINDHWGCLSTGLIDPGTQRLYQVCWVSPDNTGNPQTARYYMFVLNVEDGSQVVPPVLIQGKSGSQDFNSSMRKQRSSLVETNVNGLKTVFGCSGSFFEIGPGASGFCFAFDMASNTLTAMLALTTGDGAGVWMSGQGPAADADGYLYLVTGNGSFDGKTQWGESFLKLKYTPRTEGAPANLQVVDHWTPWTDLARTGQSARQVGASASSEDIKMPVGGAMRIPLANARVESTMTQQGTPIVRVYPDMAVGSWSDQDLGSAGPACIFSIGVCIAAGKDGIAYPIKTASLGGTTLADLANSKANCAKLAAPPVWLTMDPGPVDPCPTDPRTLNFFAWGSTAMLHMTPVQFFDPVLKSWTIFAWGENSQLSKWAVSSTGALTYIARSHEYASVDVRANPPGGMPGGFCSGSSNGADPESALLVCTIPYGNANTGIVNGRLLVYDPVHLAADGSLKVLWDSQRWGIRFLFNKFDPPVIDGGQIYVPDYNGGVEVYRLAQ